MGKRSIREQVFQLLFEIEFLDLESMPAQVEYFFERKLQGRIEDLEAKEFWAEDTPEHRVEMEKQKEAFANDLISVKEEVSKKLFAILEVLPELDKDIAEKITGWSPDRIGKIELTILRLALYEMRYEEETSIAVSINEAVELAKKFGPEKSPEFVNGVLARLASGISGQ